MRAKYITTPKTSLVVVATGILLGVMAGKNYYFKFPQVTPLEYSVSQQEVEVANEVLYIVPEESYIVKYGDTFTISEKGQYALDIFIQNFYKQYKDAIAKQSFTILDNYITDGGLNNFQIQFEEWFIKHKNIVDTQIAVTPLTIEFNSNGDLVLEILEVIELVNKADSKTEYQLQLKWQTVICENSNTFEIDERNLVESLVAYKKNDEWVQY
ncbi:MAG: hypothetical protein ATN36_04425 [Epulopiscium sp. Nele67-Bin005]|nr:MAG: hypothetical protein ATN36_04425 [Epulopiscium sp. Nele67-Bin005]